MKNYIEVHIPKNGEEEQSTTYVENDKICLVEKDDYDLPPKKVEKCIETIFEHEVIHLVIERICDLEASRQLDNIVGWEKNHIVMGW